MSEEAAQPELNPALDSLLGELADAVSNRQPVAVATIVATNRSVPRHAGSKMLIYPDGRTSGSVGGGEMEARVLVEAANALETGTAKLLDYALVDPSRGDPGVCGGDVQIYLEPHMPAATVHVIGLGHVGRAVTELAAWLGYRVVGWDDRDESGSVADGAPDAGSSIAALLEANPVDAHTFVVVVTRNVELDVEIMPPLLATPARFIGIMGSERRWSTTREKLAAAGIAAADLDRVVSPIGVDIEAENPEEIAVSILAQIIEHERRS